MVESIGSAFQSDSGGFCRTEIVLCASQDDVRSVMRLEDDSWVLLVDVDRRFEPVDFARLEKLPGCPFPRNRTSGPILSASGIRWLKPGHFGSTIPERFNTAR
jgi:hypothetical protein